jgi:pyruvate carboxylase
MFGDIVKVTPTSKVVGDLAIMMVTSGLTRAQVEDADTEVAFPESVVELMHGDLGQPLGGFPPALQAKVLKGRAPLTARPGESLPPLDLDEERAVAEKKCGRALNDGEFASYLMYPKVFLEYAADRTKFGNVSALPTPAFFYGMETGDEVSMDLERGNLTVPTNSFKARNRAESPPWQLSH